MEEGDEYAPEQTYQSGSVRSAATDATDDSEIQVCVYARALAFLCEEASSLRRPRAYNKPMPFVVSRGSLTGPSCMLSVILSGFLLLAMNRTSTNERVS